MNNYFDTDYRNNRLFKFLKSKAFIKPFLGIVVGGLLGFFYYFFVGCADGTCAITSSPYGSIVMGGFIGLMLVNSPCSRNGCSV